MIKTEQYLSVLFSVNFTNNTFISIKEWAPGLTPPDCNFLSVSCQLWPRCHLDMKGTAGLKRPVQPCCPAPSPQHRDQERGLVIVFAKLMSPSKAPAAAKHHEVP